MQTLDLSELWLNVPLAWVEICMRSMRILKDKAKIEGKNCRQPKKVTVHVRERGLEEERLFVCKKKIERAGE